MHTTAFHLVLEVLSSQLHMLYMTVELQTRFLLYRLGDSTTRFFSSHQHASGSFDFSLDYQLSNRYRHPISSASFCSAKALVVASDGNFFDV